MSRFSTWSMVVVITVLVAIFTAALWFINPSAPIFRSLLWYAEQAVLLTDASPGRLYEYGNRHFNATNPALYDINLAEKYYLAVYTKDPLHRNVLHQLARIAFLKGDLETALERIDLHLQRYPRSKNSYYVRGLIEGYMGEYQSAARDYEKYLLIDPRNWAAVNDYAWILLKLNDPEKATQEIAKALIDFPDNPWLLNSHAIALFERGLFRDALLSAQAASSQVGSVTEQDWLRAYPGNDPAAAKEGIEVLRQSVNENMHKIQDALNRSVVQ